MARRRLLSNCWPPFRKVHGHRIGKLPRVCCISPRVRRWIRIILQYSLLAFVAVILILWLGSEFQERQVKKAPDTAYFYNLSQVCGLATTYPENYYQNSSELPALEFNTFPSAEKAKSTNNTFIAHCGDCGQCSNPQDIRIYDETKNSLFADSVTCAKHALIWGRKTATKCMDQRVGFTSPCTKCWVENIMCDLRNCLLLCMWTGMWGEVETGEEQQGLNRCTLCDEKRCGPAFVRCAGSNRRRAGILSDIERDAEQEVCVDVKKGWWNDETLQEYWEATQQQGEEKEKPTSRKKLRS